MPLEDRDQLLRWVEAFVRPKTPEERAKSDHERGLYIQELITKRRAEPGDDIISDAVTSKVNGKPLNDADAEGLVRGLLGGGLDTVASNMGWIARFLAENQDHRRELKEAPELIPNAVEELLRRFSVPNIARVVAKDLVYKGVTMKKGDQVFLSAALHGMDERSFDRPLDVDFRRKNAKKHSTFGQGIHRCPGATLAIEELKVFLEE